MSARERWFFDTLTITSNADVDGESMFEYRSDGVFTGLQQAESEKIPYAKHFVQQPIKDARPPEADKLNIIALEYSLHPPCSILV